MSQPPPRDFLDPHVIARLSALALHARQPMLGNVSGKHRSPIRGSSLEFASYRKYVPGDDTRRLDWRAYARSDRFFIKEFEADTNLRLCLVVDTSGSMGFRAAGMSKLDYARRLAGVLAYLAARQGDAVGLYSAGARFVHEIPPKRNAAHLRHVLDQIGRLKPAGTTGLADALHEAAERLAQRALVVVLSDLFLQPDLLRGCLQHLRFRKHDVAVFHLVDRIEVAFQFDRAIRFVDLEGGQPVLADPATIAREYRRAMGAYLDQVETIMRDATVDYHRIGTEQGHGDVLARFLLARTPKKRR